jgi:hypothetical protein
MAAASAHSDPRVELIRSNLSLPRPSETTNGCKDLHCPQIQGKVSTLALWKSAAQYPELTNSGRRGGYDSATTGERFPRVCPLVLFGAQLTRGKRIVLIK